MTDKDREEMRQWILNLTPTCGVPANVAREHEQMLATIAANLKTLTDMVERRFANLEDSVDSVRTVINRAEGAKASIIWIVGAIGTAAGAIGTYLVK